MKKYLVALLMMGVLAVGLASCGSTSGLQANRSKNNDVVLKGMTDEIAKFDPSRKVLVSDSLYLNRTPSADKVAQIRASKNKKDFVMPGAAKKLPLFVYQLKEGNYQANDYLWAYEVVNEGADIKIKPLLINTEANKASSRTRGAIAGMPTTFDFYGSEIKAYPTKDNTLAGYEPCLVSFFLNSDEPLTFIHYSYNGRDYKTYDLNDPTQFQSLGDRVYSREINLKYGDRFSLRTQDGRSPNISPEMVRDGKFRLTGVKLLETPNNPNDYYVFQVDNWSSSQNSSQLLNEMDFEEEQVTGNKLYFKRARRADMKNYGEGYIVLAVRDIACQDYNLYGKLVQDGAIGMDASGKLQKNVIISPSYLKQLSSTTYQRYKGMIRKSYRKNEIQRKETGKLQKATQSQSDNLISDPIELDLEDYQSAKGEIINRTQ